MFNHRIYNTNIIITPVSLRAQRDNLDQKRVVNLSLRAQRGNLVQKRAINLSLRAQRGNLVQKRVVHQHLHTIKKWAYHNA